MSTTCGGYSFPLRIDTKIWLPPMSCPYAAIVLSFVTPLSSPLRFAPLLLLDFE